MENKLISVVITTYGRTDTLARAINSLLDQTYSNIEVIVVDDNKDQSVRIEVMKIVNSYKNQNISLICNPKNLGGALSRNVGIKASRGSYIAFLDDDDEYMPKKVEEQYRLFMDKNDDKLALVYCYCKEIGANNDTKNYHYDFTGHCVFEAMLDCIAATSQWMCTKDALLKVGMFSNVPCKQDSTLILKLLFSEYVIDRVPMYLSIYHSDGKTRISTSTHDKRIVGEEKLRELCRSRYSLLTPEQINEVEYSFSCRLLEHYYAVKAKEKFAISMKKVLLHPLRKKSLSAYKHIFMKFINC